MYRSGGFLSSSDRPSDLIGRGSRREDGDDDLSSSSSSPSIAGSRSRSSGGSATISWQLQCLAASVPRRVLEGMKDKVQCSSDVARDSSTSGGDAFACSGQECACLFIDVSGFTRSMELFAQWGGRGIERFWHIVNSYFGGLLQEAYCRGGDVECFAGDAMLITFRSLRVLEEATVLAISQAVWASNPPPGDWSLQLATLLCVDAAVSMLSTYSPYAITEAGFTDQQGTPLKLSLDIHGAIVAGTLDFSEHRLCGDKRSGAWYFVSGPIMEELGVTHDFSKRGQCVLGPSAVRALQPWAVKLSGDPKSDIGQVWKVPRPSESSSFSKCLIIGAKGSIPPPLLLSVGALMPPGASELPFQWPVVSILGAISAAGFDQQSQAILTDALVKYVPSTFVERLEQELATGLASESDKLDTSGRRISLASAHSRSVRNPSLPSSLPPLKPSTSNTKKRNIVKNYIWGGTRGSQSVSSTRSSTLSASTYHPHSGKQSRQTMLGELRQATVAFVKFDTGALNTPESVCITSGHSPYSPLQISPPSSPTYASPLPSRMIFSPGRDRLVSLKPGPQSKALERLWLSAAAAEALPSNETPAQHERRGFTRLSLLERVGKDCIKAADAVLELGGQVNKIIMDDKGLSLLYAFGTPGCSYEDNVARALQVALKIQEGVLESGNGGWRFGVGISSGEVCVGLLGLSSVRCEYALVGATVNMAARLASQAQAGEWGVLTEPSTVEQIVRNGGLVGAKAEFMLGMGMKAVSVGVMRLKGQAADTTLFEVVKSTTLAHSAATLNGGIGSSQPSNTALIGRMRQLSRLLGRLQIDGAAKPPAPSSCCRSTIVEGGPGMGKTTLLRHAWSLLSSSLPTEENRGRRVSLDSKGLEYSTPEGANRGCALVYHCCSHPDRLQPLSTVSGLARQIVDICRGFEADGSVLYEKLARLIGERERQLLPLLSKLGITLKYSDARSPNPVRSRESSLLQATERRSILNMLRSASGSGSAFSLHDSGNATMRGHYHELPPWELSKQLACLTVALLTAAQQNAAVEQIIVVVDDLHHSDRGSMEILLHMLQGEQSPEYASGNPSSVSFVFSSRDARYWGSQGEHWYLRLRSLPSIERIVLEPLSARQVSRLACAELDCEGLSPEVSLYYSFYSSSRCA
jgi:class 3 adenylate cyclase